MSAQPKPAGFSPAQLAALNALAAGATVSAAAEVAGVHRASVYNWMNDPDFAAEAEAARQEYAESLREQLHELSAVALRELRRLIEDPSTPASVRLRAITLVLTRPVYPKPGWALPVPVNSAAEENYIRRVSELGLEMKSYHQADSLLKAVGKAASARQEANSARQNSTDFDTFDESSNLSNAPEPMPSPAQPAEPNWPPRNAPCPCGSGVKYKRCCGAASSSH